MQREVVSVTPDDTLATALRLTREHRVRHLPVVLSNGDVVGILSDRDIRLAMPSPLTTADPERTDFLERTLIVGIMSREVITIGPYETVEDAARLLHRHRIGALPVMEADGKLAGIITETDILHAFVQLLGVSEPSTRIELALRDRPGELGRALSVIGDRAGVNIVSVLVRSQRRDGKRKAVLHLATIDPREALKALAAEGFTTGWPSLDSDPVPALPTPVPG